ncbi:MAG: prolipoprotein diacylglyceryl transferase [Bacilli bacterium]|nr:prolipoprotein diacylglyceryl transferase [Bacilli bacterium]MBQ7241009.1 prolipoprotein diacylglyceryl transferase [Bacilli bacterium]
MLDNHFVPDGYGIIPYFTIFGKEISSYSIFVGLGLIIGIIWFLITVSKEEKIGGYRPFIIVLSALFFGAIGSKILVIIENLKPLIEDFSLISQFIFTGKSIVGGLIGGYIGVIIAKKILNIKGKRFGNQIAPAIALGMAIGRIGCFLTGCCFGIKTSLPIGVNFGDGINRIPTQLIEMAFCLLLFGFLFYKQKAKKELQPGILFYDLILYYFIFRFFIEFIRGTEKNILCFSIYQIISILGIIYIVLKMKKEKDLWLKTKLEQPM